MADERCVSPGDDPRNPGRWLDRETAERLLRGEPLEAVDTDGRHQADRLAEALEALGALSIDSAPEDAELPGEAAALAAFRKVRADGNDMREPSGPRSRERSADADVHPPESPVSSDAGLIHLGRPAAHRHVPSRWGRPLRYGLAAALAAGMIGGAAVAATSGVLPFGGEEPEPGSSATVEATPDRPLLSPSPEKAPGGGAQDPRPEGSAGGPSGGPSPSGEARGSTGPGARSGSDDTWRQDRPGHGWGGIFGACRDYREGKPLDADRRRGLESAADGEQIKRYCKGILKNWRGRGSGDNRHDHGDGRNGPGRDGWGGGEGRDGDRGDGDRGDDDRGDGAHIRPGVYRGAGGTSRDGGAPADPTALLSVRPSTMPTRSPVHTPSRTTDRAPAPDVSALTRPATAEASGASERASAPAGPSRHASSAPRPPHSPGLLSSLSSPS